MLATAALYDPELTDGDKVALAVMSNYAWSIGSETFEMTGDQLAVLLGKSRRSAMERVTALEAAGHIKVEGRRGLNRPNRYTVRLPRKSHTRRAETDTSGWEESRTPGCAENDTASTTYTTPDEKDFAPLRAVDNPARCEHGERAGRNAKGALYCPLCRTNDEPLF